MGGLRTGLDALRLAVFLPFLLGALSVHAVLLANTIQKRQSHYFLRVRFPSIVLLELMQAWH